MKDYSNLGLNNRLRAQNSLSNRESTYETALTHSMRVEPTPYIHRTAVLQRGGTVQTTLGGIVDFRDATGGTTIFTYDPVTGVVTLNGPINLNGTFTLGTTTIFTGPVTFNGAVAVNSQGTINNTGLVFAGGATNGTSAIRMYNSGGTERLTLGITSSGFGFGTMDEIQFKGNTGNSINENFGVRVKTADSSGVHALRVANSDGNEKFAFTSAGFMEIKGTIADPGGAGLGVVRLFVQRAAGKDQLRAEFNTGTSVVVAAEP